MSIGGGSLRGPGGAMIPVEDRDTRKGRKMPRLYRTDIESEADLKVYVTDIRSEADLVVYETGNEWEATESRFWCYTDIASEADRKVFFTDSQWNADLTVFRTDVQSDAQWQNTGKQELL